MYGEGSQIGHAFCAAQHSVGVISRAEGRYVESFHERSVLRTSTFYSKFRKILLQLVFSPGLPKNSATIEVTLNAMKVSKVGKHGHQSG